MDNINKMSGRARDRDEWKWAVGRWSGCENDVAK